MARARSRSRVTLSFDELLRLAVALVLVCVAVVASSSKASAITLPPGWSHAQVNVVIKHVAHTLYYDRGSITRVVPGALTLRERDGSVVFIRVAPSAAITLGDRAVALAALSPGEFAETVRVDGAPAKQVHARRVGAAG